MLTPQQKKEFIQILTSCKKKYSKIEVTTEDPLKFAINDPVWNFGDSDCFSPIFFGGCTAGISGFNVNCEGTITPCAVLLKPIVNIVNLSVAEIVKKYTSSNIIVNLAERCFKGKCGSCSLIRLCGGCRAVAEGMNSDYLSSDVTCWL